MLTAPLADSNTKDVAGVSTLLGNAEGVLQLSTQGKPVKLLLLSVKFQRISGASATNFQPRLSNKAGSAADSINQFYRGTLTAAGTLVASADINQPFKTDAEGKIYLNMDGNVANGWAWEIWYAVLG